MSKFGGLLRQYRKQGIDYERKNKLTIERFAELLSEQLGLHAESGYTTQTISNWELSKTFISHRDRHLLIAVIKVLQNCDGITLLAEANALLEAGDYRRLNEEEIKRIDRNWLSQSLWVRDPKEPAREENTTLRNRMRPILIPGRPPQGIFGREREIIAVQEQLYLKEDAKEVAPIALVGMGGIGKTTLATALGHIVQRYFPDGVLWVELGINPNLRTLLDRWGQLLGLDLNIAKDEDMCRDLLKSALYQRQMLLIIDDIWMDSLADGRLFTSLAGPQCRTILTTRDDSVANHLALGRKQNVNLLSAEAAMDLLAAFIPDYVSSDSKSAETLCYKLEYLPLALTLAGRLLANEAAIPSRQSRLIRKLIDEHEARLALIQEEPRFGLDDRPSLGAILGLSIESLSEDEQNRFALLSVFGGEPLTWDFEAAIFIWNCSEAEAEETLSKLIQRGLVQPKNNRYQLHALLADYSAIMREKRGL